MRVSTKLQFHSCNRIGRSQSFHAMLRSKCSTWRFRKSRDLPGFYSVLTGKGQLIVARKNTTLQRYDFLSSEEKRSWRKIRNNMFNNLLLAANSSYRFLVQEHPKITTSKSTSIQWIGCNTCKRHLGKRTLGILPFNAWISSQNSLWISSAKSWPFPFSPLGYFACGHFFHVT